MSLSLPFTFLIPLHVKRDQVARVNLNPLPLPCISILRPSSPPAYKYRIITARPSSTIVATAFLQPVSA
ncbi:hypothetical protein E2C01_023992 [Portunus trituberculatus]|uniref:Uncharacterized protein n=1 Tax=Portunus trituberculatus TaxID=210409 RepID=A0A5B7E9I4_PORTR|nr:hypothetical protein [Portunus trituberculatus]